MSEQRWNGADGYVSLEQAVHELLVEIRAGAHVKPTTVFVTVYSKTGESPDERRTVEVVQLGGKLVAFDTDNMAYGGQPTILAVVEGA